MMVNSKNLKNYIDNFDDDLERIKSLTDFAKSAIKFICAKRLYVEFLQYQAREAEETIKEVNNG